MSAIAVGGKARAALRPRVAPPPPTGRRVEFPVCAVFTFDETDRIQAETVYFDRMTVLSQLGVMW